MREVRSIVESLLFAADKPLSLSELSKIVEVDKKIIKKVLADLKVEYERENRGFRLRQLAGGYRLYTSPESAPYIEKLLFSSGRRRSILTQAALETLAIVAYKQPVTRGEINEIRGVNSEAVITTLIERELIKEVGRTKDPGNPILYGTTPRFLETFGLNNLSELPPLENFASDEITKKQIEHHLFVRKVGIDMEESSRLL